MKTILIILLILVAEFSNAQEIPKGKESGFFYLPIENVLGIIDFNLEEVAKRLRLKCQSEEYRKLDRIISWYKVKTDSIYNVNKSQLEAIENLYWSKVAVIDDRNNFDHVYAIVKEYIEEVKPYSPPIQALELELGSWVSGFLSDKQYSKWEAYLAKKHKEIKPQTPMPMDGPPTKFL